MILENEDELREVVFKRAVHQTEVGWKSWSPTDRVIYGLEDDDGTNTQGFVLA